MEKVIPQMDNIWPVTVGGGEKLSWTSKEEKKLNFDHHKAMSFQEMAFVLTLAHPEYHQISYT